MAWRGVNCGGSTLEDALLWPEKKLREDRPVVLFRFWWKSVTWVFLDSIQMEGCCAGVIFASTNIQAQQCEGNGGHNPMHDLLSQRHLPTTQKPFWLGATEHPTATFSIGGSSLRIATQNNSLLALCRIATMRIIANTAIHSLLHSTARAGLSYGEADTTLCCVKTVTFYAVTTLRGGSRASDANIIERNPTKRYAVPSRKLQVLFCLSKRRQIFLACKFSEIASRWPPRKFIWTSYAQHFPACWV